MLDEKTKSTLKLMRELTTFRKSNTNTKRYFEAVQALINNPTRDSMSDTIGNISATIAREKHRQRNKLALNASTYEHESYLRQLSKMTVNAHYAKQIQNIFHQDKNIISQHLALQKKQLKQIATIYERHMETASRLYFKNNVQKPYLEAQHLTLPSWAPSRREWLEMKLTELNLDELIDAHRNVKKAWARLFQGTSNASDINHMLMDTKELIDTASHLKKASQTTTPDLVNLSTSTTQ